MKRTLTAAQRRLMRRHAPAVASFMAATTFHRDKTGRISPVTHPAAQAVLERGFKKLIHNDCRPVVLKLSDREARALPCWHETEPRATWWAAFGLDADLRGTWCARWSVSHGGMSDAEAADATEVMMFEALARACNSQWLPQGGSA